MGISASGASGGSPAAIYAVVDQLEYYPGSEVTGKVYLNVHKNELSCVSVGSRIVGQEYAEVHYTTHSKKKTHHHTARARRNFLSSQFQLAEVSSGILPRGNYEYPFSFELPRSSPGSMHYRSPAGKNQCSISYMLEVWLDRPGFFRYDVKNKCFINVVALAPAGPSFPLYIEPTRKPCRSWCGLFRNGDILMGASAGSNFFIAGQPVAIHYAIQNSSNARIKAIEIKLRQRVKFHANGHHSSTHIDLFHTRIPIEHTGLDLTPIEDPTSSNTSVSASEAASNSMREIAHILAEGRTQAHFTLPFSSLADYDGDLIFVEHNLYITAHTPFGTSSPQLCQKVQIYTRPACSSSSSGGQGAPGFSQAVPQAQGLDGSDAHYYQPAPSAPPADWAPLQAQIFKYPPLAMVVPIDDDAYASQQQGSVPTLYTTYAKPVGATALCEQSGGSGFNVMIQSLNTDPYGSLASFIETRRNSDRSETYGDTECMFTPSELFAIFDALQRSFFSFDQVAAAGLLAPHLQGCALTCDHLAHAARGSSMHCRREVVEALLVGGAVPTDAQQNAHALQSQLSAFEFMTIERYLK